MSKVKKQRSGMEGREAFDGLTSLVGKQICLFLDGHKVRVLERCKKDDF